MMQYVTLGLSVSFFLCIEGSTISLATSTSDDSYLFVESVGFGSDKQSFKLLVDTTDATSWVYNSSVETEQDSFVTADSSTYVGTEGTSNEIVYSYQGESTTLQYATDALWVGDVSLAQFEFALAMQNFSIAESQQVSGVFSLDRDSGIVSGLFNNGSIENETLTLDVANSAMHFGPWTPSSINNQSNATGCSSTSNAFLQQDWVFDITVNINGGPAFTNQAIRGVIDAASPYITIYARSDSDFLLFWHQIDQSTSTLNCNYSTRVCSNPDDILWSITIAVEEVNWNFTLFRDDLLDGEYIQFLYDDDRNFTTDAQYVLFLGRPFLKHVVVAMDYKAETLTFYTTAEASTSLNWLVIGIVFGCVAAFAALFFGAYCWKYGRIAPPSAADVEEQVSLLRGPAQAVGSGQGSINALPPYRAAPPMSGSGGLDDDDDDVNRQLQEVQRQSAIEAQQVREQQVRVDNERRTREQQQQQQEQQQLHRRESGGRLGGQAAKPQNAASLRAMRLAALEKQQSDESQNDE